MNRSQMGFVVLSSLMAFANAQAAAPKAEFQPSAAKTVLVQATKDALDLSTDERLQTLRTQGDEGYRNLLAIMKDEQLPVEPRWRATMSLARLGGTQSVPELESAMKRNEWFMRSAGLMAITNVDHKKATKWARVLLSDRALVVRASAVDVIASLKEPSTMPLLWQKLYAAENFKNKQSLFVRRRIIQALAELETHGHEKAFVKVLDDRDESLHPYAIAALERLTGKRLGQDTDSLRLRRGLWKTWALNPTKVKAPTAMTADAGSTAD